MRRTIAGTAASLFTALVIGVPLASAAHAAPTTLHCASSTAAECVLLDDLSAQLGPIAPLLGTALAPLTGQAQDLAARSDGGAGVPTAEVIDVSQALLGQLDALPAPVQALVGATRLGEVTGTLQALVGALTAPAVGPQQSASGSGATPARATASPAAAPFGGLHSTDASSSGGSAATGGSASSDHVPDVPVGDPLTLAPLALPEFGFDQAFTPVVTVDAAAPSAEDTQLATLADAMSRDSGSPELVVVAILSVLLLAGAGIAQLQANRHQIPG